MCAVGYSGLSGGGRPVGSGARGGATGRNRARRGAVDPASGLHARAKCADPGDAREPAPRFRGGRPWPARPDRDRWERYQPVSRCRPKACPRESGGNRAVQRTHPFRAPRPHLTRRERHHHRERQAHARAHPGQAPHEVRLELEAAVQTGVDPFQGRAPAVAALPCGAPVRPESNPRNAMSRCSPVLGHRQCTRPFSGYSARVMGRAGSWPGIAFSSCHDSRGSMRGRNCHRFAFSAPQSSPRSALKSRHR